MNPKNFQELAKCGHDCYEVGGPMLRVSPVYDLLTPPSSGILGEAATIKEVRLVEYPSEPPANSGYAKYVTFPTIHATIKETDKVVFTNTSFLLGQHEYHWVI